MNEENDIKPFQPKISVALIVSFTTLISFNDLFAIENNRLIVSEL